MRMYNLCVPIYIIRWSFKVKLKIMHNDLIGLLHPNSPKQILGWLYIIYPEATPSLKPIVVRQSCCHFGYWWQVWDSVIVLGCGYRVWPGTEIYDPFRVVFDFIFSFSSGSMESVRFLCGLLHRREPTHPPEILIVFKFLEKNNLSIHPTS